MSSEHIDVPKIEPGMYRHFKGKLYLVIAVALHSETQEPMVVYKPQYESDAEYWVRPYEMFVEEVTRDGETFPRFKKIDETLE